MRHIRGIAGNGIVLIALNAQGGETLDKGIGGGLAGILGDNHGAYIKAQAPEHVRQAEDIVVIADAQVAAHLALFNVPGADGNDDLHIVLHGGQHADLAVGLEAGQHPGGMVVVKELAAELQIQLIAELAAALLDVLGLQGQILVVVESDLHVQYLFFTHHIFKITLQLYIPGRPVERGFPFFREPNFGGKICEKFGGRAACFS